MYPGGCLIAGYKIGLPYVLLLRNCPFSFEKFRHLKWSGLSPNDRPLNNRQCLCICGQGEPVSTPNHSIRRKKFTWLHRM
uniref:Uncharacterized protein n=1 Tax=Coccidioides posadasii RMSCC 3488 TaxID=454284 RepID=A0A0J6EVZ5_COCPO|nr:hypothetical protein CPAG_01083 [Coccidioides posadasii RMSCC 3488]